MENLKTDGETFYRNIVNGTVGLLLEHDGSNNCLLEDSEGDCSWCNAAILEEVHNLKQNTQGSVSKKEDSKEQEEIPSYESYEFKFKEAVIPVSKNQEDALVLGII